MADDQFSTSGNWWDSGRNKYDTGASQSSSSGLTTVANFAWQPDMVDTKPRSSMGSMSMSDNSSMVFHDNQKPQTSDSAASSDPNLHMMALGLSNQPLDWNQPSLLVGEKPAAASSFRSMLQDNLNTNANFGQETGIALSQVQWGEKLISGGCNSESSTNEFKQVNSGFSLDQPHQFSPQYSCSDRTIVCQGLPSTFQVDSSALYGNPSIIQGLLGTESNQTQQPSLNMPYPASYGFNNSSDLVPSWSKVPQFLRSSPPKQQASQNQLSFTNNTPFCNTADMSIKDVRPSHFPSPQSPFSSTSFDLQPKNISSEMRDSNAFVKKSFNAETASNKRPRSEAPSPMPGSKVIRKEKMGDRITGLQQLVSPFGKTDTASVLSEAIEYIKFLHEQVTLLISPYMKSGASMQHQQQSSGKSKEAEGSKQDLRSRGLCLVPVSSTFPVTHETTADYWTPTFGGTFR